MNSEDREFFAEGIRQSDLVRSLGQVECSDAHWHDERFLPCQNCGAAP